MSVSAARTPATPAREGIEEPAAKPSSSDGPPGSAPLIDLEHLALYTAGDDALRDEVLGMFEEQAEMWVAMLKPESGDEVWRNAAHALKGSARGVGAFAVGDICAQAETQIGDGASAVPRRAALLEALKVALSATIAEIRNLRNEAEKAG